MSMNLSTGKMTRLKETLDNLYDIPRLKAHIKNDPIEFPHLYDDPKDIEIAGFIASSLAFGRIDLFKPVIKKVLSFADSTLYEYVINFEPHKDIKHFENLYYRMCKGRDIAAIVFILREVIRKHGTIGTLFHSCYNNQTSLRDTLGNFVRHLKEIDTTPIYGRNNSTGLLQLIASPENGGPCKRLNMYLRWMVRCADGIDFGLWKQILRQPLSIPRYSYYKDM